MGKVLVDAHTGTCTGRCHYKGTGMVHTHYSICMLCLKLNVTDTSTMADYRKWHLAVSPVQNLVSSDFHSI